MFIFIPGPGFFFLSNADTSSRVHPPGGQGLDSPVTPLHVPSSCSFVVAGEYSLASPSLGPFCFPPSRRRAGSGDAWTLRRQARPWRALSFWQGARVGALVYAMNAFLRTSAKTMPGVLRPPRAHLARRPQARSLFCPLPPPFLPRAIRCRMRRLIFPPTCRAVCFSRGGGTGDGGRD